MVQNYKNNANLFARNEIICIFASRNHNNKQLFKTKEL